MFVPYIGSVNQKIDIFKITCKVLLCVGVSLIKKTLAWQQILCITCSEKIEKYLQICIYLRWHRFLRRLAYFLHFATCSSTAYQDLLQHLPGWSSLSQVPVCRICMAIIAACKPSGWDTCIWSPKIELFLAVAVCCLVCCRPMFLPKLSRHVLCNSEVY